MKLDPAILEALGLSRFTTTVSSHGGSGFSSTAKIVSRRDDGSTLFFFLKTGHGADAEVMFKGEYESLNAIHSAVPTLCPKAFAHGALADSRDGYFLATEFLDLSGSGKPTTISLAEQLAKLHSTPSPNGKFGFPVTTCCGSTKQDNTWDDNWPRFFGERRLMAILKESEKTNGPDKELRQLVERTVEDVVPRLVPRKVVPVCVHGDLWSGNASRGRKEGAEEVVPLVYDASACYAHNEYELGIMKMFGGFGAAFFREYHNLIPRTEPVGEYDDRIQFYHQLNHHAIFGSSYRGGAKSIMTALLRRYGKGK